MKKLVLILFILMGSLSIFAQSNQDTERRWLILLSPEENHPQLQEQMDVIQANQEAALERKIGVIQLTNQGAKSLFNVPMQGFRFADTFQNMRSDDTDFEAVLIGLDNTIKLRRKRAIDLDELFSLIDSMPMRQREIRQQENVEEDNDGQ